MTTDKDTEALINQVFDDLTGAYGTSVPWTRVTKARAEVLWLVRAAVHARQDRIKELEANFHAEIQEMSERFRAVNIARVAEQVGVDVAALMEERNELKDKLIEAMEVIKPFAEAANELDTEDEGYWDIWEHPVALNITIEHLRDALAFTQKMEKSDGSD